MREFLNGIHVCYVSAKTGENLLIFREDLKFPRYMIAISVYAGKDSDILSPINPMQSSVKSRILLRLQKFQA